MLKKLLYSALAVCLLAPAGNKARADDTTPAEPPKAKLADFRWEGHNKFRSQLSRRLKVSAKEVTKEMESVATNEAIYHTLLKYDPAFKAAAELSRDPALGVVAWHTLFNKFKGSAEGVPGSNGYIEYEAVFQLGRSYLLAEEFEKAVQMFERITFDGQAWCLRGAEAQLFSAYAYGKLEETKKARHILGQMIRNRQPHTPERYHELAHWFLRELKGQGTGPLLEISKSMETIRRHLKRGKTGFNPTQSRQRDVVKELQRLIELLEEQQKGGGGGDCKKCKGKGCRNCQQQKPGKSGNKPSNPLKDSQLPGGSSKVGKLGRDPKRGSSESWGGLKKRDRGKVLQLIKERFPSQYKEIIEQYYRSLNDKGARPGRDK